MICSPDFEIQRVQLGMALTPAGKHSLVIVKHT